MCLVLFVSSGCGDSVLVDVCAGVGYRFTRLGFTLFGGCFGLVCDADLVWGCGGLFPMVVGVLRFRGLVVGCWICLLW